MHEKYYTQQKESVKKRSKQALRDTGTTLNGMAVRTYYERLTEEERAAVDAFTKELAQKLSDLKGGRTIGIGEMGLRELALALYIHKAYPAETMEQSIYRAVYG